MNLDPNNLIFDRSLDLKDRTDYLYGQALAGIIVTGFTYYALLYFFADSAPKHLISWLSVAMGIVLGCRVIDWFFWRLKAPTADTAKPYNLRFKSFTATTGLVWAIAGCTLFEYQSIEERYFTLLSMGSMTGGAVIVLATSNFLSVVYPSLLLLPMSIVALGSGSDSLFKVGILGIIYWILMISFSNRASKISKQWIRLKNDQATLRAQIESERNELSNAYTQLRVAKEKLDQTNLSLEEKVAERTRQIEHLSTIDSLTGLLNRRAFVESMDTVFKSSENNKLALFFIDLNGFKSINDALGHYIGDEVLKVIANRLKDTLDLRLLSRWGGDEFVLAIENVSDAKTRQNALALLESIARPITFESHTINTSASIGISIYPQHGDLPIELIQKADVAMYKIKRSLGEGVLLFDENLKSEVVEQQRIISGLRQAIELKQFFLVYQPIIQSEDKSVWGFETLIRWRFGDEMMNPDQFIGLAEKSGSISEIGLWVLDTACRELSQMTSDQSHHLSVNVSAMQLVSKTFIRDLELVLQSTQFDPKRLHLEITESVLMNQDSAVLDTIMALKSRGISLSIDDFGTGYSNLSRLTQLPASTLKIDKAFVQSEHQSADVILRASLYIAKEFGYKTVAEGVETETQLEYLSSLEVDLMQGYFFAKPMVFEQAREWLEHYDR